jgi:hypothetical protein
MRAAPILVVTFAVALPPLAGAGCDDPEPDGPPTWEGATRAIFEAKCATCHHPGGIGPMPLTSYAEVVGIHDVVKAAIDSGAMPPWKADPTCNSYRNDFSLTAEDKSVLAAWFAAGHPEGEPAPGAAPSGDGRRDPRSPDLRYDELFPAAEEPYLPQRRDDYRCFAIAWPHRSIKFITGFDMIPGDPSNVHHVNIFLNPPHPTTDFVAIDAEDPAPGYSCARGDRVLQSSLIGAWAPGASGVRYPEGTGQLVEPGSSITLEVHYAAATGVEDASSLALQIEDTVERRAMGAAFWWFNNWERGGMAIPAGEASVTHEVQVDPRLQLAVVAPWLTARLLEVHVAAVHMHQLGSSGELSIRSPVGDTCLVHIPAWDFHWQMGYELATPATLFLGEDELYLRCTWDNSAENQPVVEGSPTEPRDVNWGGGTADEMCIGFLYLVPAR